MSDKKDERDIDEILASIDAMLTGKDGFSGETDERKENVEQAARESEDALGLSSSADENTDTHSKLQPFEPLDEPLNEALDEPEKPASAEDDVEQTEESSQEKTDASEPRQRIVLTEEYLEPSAQESLPLWAAQTPSSQDESESAPDETANETAKDKQVDDIETPQSDDLVEALNQGDELAESIGDLDDLDLPDLNDIAEEQIPGNKAIPTETAVADEEPAEPDALKEEAENTEAEEKTDNKTAEFDAVFAAIAHDDTITFDIGEAMDEDTVYDIQVLDNELVEAFVQDVVQENEALDRGLDNESNEQNTEVFFEASNIDDPNIEETSHAKTNAPETNEPSVEDMDAQESSFEAIEENTAENVDEGQTEAEVVADADETTDVVENEVAEDTVTEQVTEAVEQQNSDEFISLNPDELDPLIEAVSDEVRIKINQHLQQILPELISEALLEHLANQRDNSED